MGATITAGIRGKLEEAMVHLQKSEIWPQIVEPKSQVLARFQPILHRSNLPKLTAEEFKPFLYIEHNCHWTGLYRQGNRLTADMPKLRAVLAVLLDESRPIDDRLNEIDGQITGLGKAITTAILTVAYPTKYGVWNSTSEAGLVSLGLWPAFERGEGFGSRYSRVNDVLTAARDALQTDFWTLDALWWQLVEGDVVPQELKETPGLADGSKFVTLSQSFGLERHLHDFLFDNWDHTDLGKEWAIHAEPGEPDAGYEYITPVGRIDLLARHRTQNKWLVIELKRKDTTDATVGQAARYMGWVREHLAKPGDEVHGLIIAQQTDAAMHYAVRSVPHLAYQLYEVEFRLKPAPVPALKVPG